SGAGAWRLPRQSGELARGRANRADQSARRAISVGRQAGDSYDATRRLYYRLRCSRGTPTGKYSGGGGIELAAVRKRTIRAGSGTRGLRVFVRRKENAGTHRPHLKNR